MSNFGFTVSPIWPLLWSSHLSSILSIAESIKMSRIQQNTEADTFGRVLGVMKLLNHQLLPVIPDWPKKPTRIFQIYILSTVNIDL